MTLTLSLTWERSSRGYANKQVGSMMGEAYKKDGYDGVTAWYDI